MPIYNKLKLLYSYKNYHSGFLRLMMISAPMTAIMATATTTQLTTMATVGDALSVNENNY